MDEGLYQSSRFTLQVIQKYIYLLRELTIIQFSMFFALIIPFYWFIISTSKTLHINGYWILIRILLNDFYFVSWLAIFALKHHFPFLNVELLCVILLTLFHHFLNYLDDWRTQYFGVVLSDLRKLRLLNHTRV